jgi:hypothetical protein
LTKSKNKKKPNGRNSKNSNNSNIHKLSNNTFKQTDMNLLRWELKIGMVKGLVFGVRPYEFEGEETYEIDHVVYIGIFQIILTMIYEKD